MNSVAERLKDIKPPVDVPDHSLLVFLLLSAIAAAAVAAAVWFFVRRPKRRKRGTDPVQEAKMELKKLDFADVKSAVYTFDEFLPILASGDDRIMDEFEKLQKRLERYKYKKEVPPLEDSDIKKMRELIKKAAG